MQSIIPPLIAVIGSDGSGKSTVCEHLITVVEKYGAAERVHLGKQAGNVGRAVTKLPLMGSRILLHHQAQGSDKWWNGHFSDQQTIHIAAHSTG